MLKINKLNKSFLDKKNNKIEVLNNINIQFGNNGLYFIVGKSGSGKAPF